MAEQTSWLSGNPLPWWYNPSSWNQRLKMAFIALIAVGISLYLAFYQWRFIDSVWDPIFGKQSQLVLDSDVSHQIRKWIFIPDAFLGAIAYLSDVVFALAGCTRRWQYRPWLVILFGIDVIPLGIVSATLVFLQGAVVKQWCFLCIVTAIISLILVVLAYDEVISSIIYLHRYWKKTRSFSKLWKTFWGFASEEAIEIGETMLKEREKNVG